MILVLDREIRTVINTTKTYQEILGFGGAITDSVAIVRNQLLEASEDLAKLLHEQYYGAKGKGLVC
jgi:O-glycosyl hydrolase